VIHLLTDFHTHILPGMDDGSRSVEESVEMLRREAAQGIRQVVLTPHFYPNRDSFQDFLKRQEHAFASLQEATAKMEGIPRMFLGAEVYFYPGMSHSEQLRQLAIRGMDSILIEMPFAPWTERVYQELENVYTRQGLLPIIAHIDRYIRPFRTFGIPDKLAELPVLVQANSSFFLDRRSRGLALKLLKRERIHLLGSDCHGLEHRPPNLASCMDMIRKKAGNDPFNAVMHAEKTALTPCK